MVDVSQGEIQTLLDEVWSTDTMVRQNAAATLSKVAAKASDPMLEELSAHSPIFVELLMEDEPLLRAYTACIIANVAFLEVGQKRVMEAGGVPLIVRLLRQRDRKVQLHSSAAVQNLTYKNPLCCAAVLEEGGEKWLNKLLRHKSEDIQQFAAGALANLQLYRRSLEQDRAGKGGKGASSKRSSARSTQAATQIQAAVRGHLARVRYEELLRDLHGPNAERSRASGMGNGFGRRQAAGTTDLVGSNRYDVFRVKDVRTQLDILPPSLPPIGGGGAPPAQRSAAIRNVGALQPAVPGASTKGGPRRLEPLSKPPPPLNSMSLLNGGGAGGAGPAAASAPPIASVGQQRGGGSKALPMLTGRRQ